jgi:hypothetical protein
MRPAALAVALACCAWAQTPGIERVWHGTLAAAGAKVRIGLRVVRTAEGGLSATLEAVDQGVKGLPVSLIEQNQEAVRFEAPMMQARFEGRLDAGGERISGVWTQSGAPQPFVWERGEAAALKRPQEPRRPFPYDEEEVAYENKKDGVRLAGTLTLPKGAGPFPALLPIPGSGVHGREETIAPAALELIANWVERHTR